ncbi:MAG: hypothetical protein KME04_04650 [Pleurocapsa minor GSE-CHR-MK-17-07R]|nr:hypothetical protein [Pleurocapsa minor GSE-CHR-MK 17-07R]
MKKLFSLVALLLLLPAVVFAQNGTLPIETTGGPSFLNARLPNYPDPQIAGMLAGGDIDAASLGIGADCVGNIYTIPDGRLELTSSTALLRAYFTAHEGGDTSLVVLKPDGTFVCNDDAVGLDPVVEIVNAVEGQYRFWVGTVNTTALIPGYLVVTAGISVPGALDVPALYSSVLAAATNNGTNNTIASPTPGTGLDFNSIFGTEPTLTPAVAATPATAVHAGMSVSAAPMPPALNTAASFYGRGQLAAGFQPDPAVINMSAGGSLEASELTIGRQCQGFINNQPEYIIDYAGGGELLRLFFMGDSDSTLMIAGPGNTWYCSDDYAGETDPLVDIVNPAGGEYAIWVGTRVVDTFVGGDLVVTANPDTDPKTFGN